MDRIISNQLLSWKNKANRKVLLLRGARQVGKTYSVRELGKSFKYYLEVNFESDRTVHEFFQKDLDPKTIIENLSAYYAIPIVEGETLLFFDEIQTCVSAISSLRFFYEKLPGLHLLAAGSLIEFALNEIPSFGVGRIESLFMFPLSFDEFLMATGEYNLLMLKKNASPEKPLLEPIHNKLIELLKKFLLIGGMPEVVKTYIETSDLLRVQEILDQFINSMNEDFAKYKRKLPASLLRAMFEGVVYHSGQKFKFSSMSEVAGFRQAKAALELFEKAGLIYKVQHTAANGIPLGAEVNPKKFKIILFDHGIFQRLSGLHLSDILLAKDFTAINKGNLAEQFAGMELIKNSLPTIKPRLFYWHREKRGSNAEVDYILQIDERIIPVEIKSGSQGKMQSLFLMLSEKKISQGVRVSLENFSKYDKISVYPLYGINNIFNR
jgi:predicted AAA+ superfamily ATPase